MNTLDKANSQLIARCLFCKATGKVKYENYMKFYTLDKQDF